MEKKGSVGNKLRVIREERGLSQRELAQRAGISTNAISLIERDENSPSVSTLQNLAGALNIRMSYFFDDHEPTQVLHVKADSRPVIIDVHKNTLSYVTLRERFLRPKSLARRDGDASLRSA